MSIKTKKSIAKRFKFAKNGKVLHRPMGQDHFRAKKSGKKVRNSRKWIALSKADAKIVKKILH